MNIIVQKYGGSSVADKEKLVVIVWVKGIDKFGNITNLDSGGSDLSEVAIKVVVNVKKCEMYTDA